MKKIIREFTFRSASSPGTTYKTLLYEDGSCSCNCPGWTRRVGPGGKRECKHIISAGLAPVEVRGSDPVGVKMKASVLPGPCKTQMQMGRVIRRFSFED